MNKIPTFQNVSADFTQRIELGNQLVQIRIVYNIRSEHFYLHFEDQDLNKVTGIKIVPDWLLLRSHKAFLNFKGNLIVIKDDAPLAEMITYNSFGNGYNLYYITETEESEWETENGFQ